MSPTFLVASTCCANWGVQVHGASNETGSTQEIVAMNGLAVKSISLGVSKM